MDKLESLEKKFKTDESQFMRNHPDTYVVYFGKDLPIKIFSGKVVNAKKKAYNFLEKEDRIGIVKYISPVKEDGYSAEDISDHLPDEASFEYTY